MEMSDPSTAGRRGQAGDAGRAHPLPRNPEAVPALFLSFQKFLKILAMTIIGRYPSPASPDLPGVRQAAFLAAAG
jgi:hypothetical protein